MMMLSVAQLLNHYTAPRPVDIKPERVKHTQLVKGMLNKTFDHYKHVMRDQTWMSAEQIADKVGNTKFVVTQQMRKLKDEGYVERMTVDNSKGNRPMYLWRWK